MHGGEVEHLGAGTAVMAVSVVVNIVVSRHLFKVARQEDSLALEADAHHLSTDVFTSLGVAVGLAVVWGYRAWTGGSTALDIVDPIVAILVALFILKIGAGLTKNAVGHLLDRGLPEAELEVIRGILRNHPTRARVAQPADTEVGKPAAHRRARHDGRRRHAVGQPRGGARDRGRYWRGRCRRRTSSSTWTRSTRCRAERRPAAANKRIP